MGEHRLPDPPFPGGHNTAFRPAQGLADHVIQVTQEAQREALLPCVDDLVNVAEDFPHIAERKWAEQESYWNDPIFKIEPVNLGNAQEEQAAQAEPERIEDDALAQLEADDRFEYTVDEIVAMMARLRADCECCQKLITSGLPTKMARLVDAHRRACLTELKRLRAGRVVV